MVDLGSELQPLKELIVQEIEMGLLTGGPAQENQHKSLRRILVRRLATIALLAVVAMSHPLAAVAQELTPLRESKQKLNNIISLLPGGDAEFKFHSPNLNVAKSFNSMVVAVEPPFSPAEWELMDVSADGPALTDYMRNAIETRLAELGVADQIALHMTTSELQKPTADCGEIRMLLSLRAHEVELDGRSVVAVVVELFSWAGATIRQPDSKKECLGHKGPPWSGIDGSKVFLVDRGDRDRALVETKQTILSFVDGVILYRLVASNDTARRTVLSLIKGGN